MSGCLRMQNYRHTFHSRCNFLKCLQPFAPYLGFKIGETSDVASRMSETFDKAPTDRVRNLQEYDRQAAITMGPYPSGEPSSASRALILGSSRAALIHLALPIASRS